MDFCRYSYLTYFQALPKSINRIRRKRPRKTTTFPFPSTSFLQISQRIPEPSLHLPQYLTEVIGQALPHLLYDLLGDLLVVRFGEAAGDAGEGVAVAAERDGEADGTLEIRAVEEGDDGFRHRALTTLLKRVPGTDLLARAAQVVAEMRFHILLDLRFGLAGSAQEDGGGHGLRPLDALRVVVGDAGRDLRHPQGLLQRAERPAHGTHPHRRAVAP